VTGEWRKLHIEDLNDLYYSRSIIPVIKSKKKVIGGACSTYGREAYSGF